MSETSEIDAFIEALNDDWDYEFAALTTHAKKLERERDQFRKDYLDMKRERNSLIDQRDCAITIHESHLASSSIQTSILAEKHNDMLRSRNQWRECAELFANSLCRPKGDNPTAKAFAEFDRLKGETK
jgi:hypothetical protein